MSYEKIVTLFDTLAHAEAAERNLIKAGFDESDISIIRNEDIDRSDLDGEQSIWQKLFGETLTDEDRAIYSEAVRQNGTVLTIRVDEDERAKALAVLNRHQISDETRYYKEPLAHTDTLSPVAGTAAIAGTTAATHTPLAHEDNVVARELAERENVGHRAYLTGDETQDEILQLAKEDLEIGKRIESEGQKNIRRYVVEHDVSRTINLKEQHAEVLRRKVDRPVDGNIDWSDKEISVEEYAEKPVVNKTARVVEEVVVKKVNTDHDQVIEDTVREQKVDVSGENHDAAIDPVKRPL